MEDQEHARDFNYKDILDLHIKYVDYILAKTYLSHQKVRNINLTGSEVESEIRLLFQNLIPERFRVTHGYILYAEDSISMPKLSRQVDFILVDNLVASKLFTLDKHNGMEIVPVECVVGVFEIKRTLTMDSFAKAAEHLESIVSAVSIKKDDTLHYLPGGIPLNGLVSGIHSNPLLGIFSLDHSLSNDQTTATHLIHKASFLKLDFIASLSGLLVCPVDTPNSDEPVNFLVSNIYDDPNRHYCYLNKQVVSQSTILSRLFGYINAYLANCTGRKINVKNYFFNKNTWELLNYNE